MFLTECSTPEREEEIYKILIFCINNDIEMYDKHENEKTINHRSD